MPVFYLHIENGEGFQPDKNGQNFEDDDAVVVEAGRTAGSILTDDLRKGLSNVAISIYVEDAQAHRIATVKVNGAVER